MKNESLEIVAKQATYHLLGTIFSKFFYIFNGILLAKILGVSLLGLYSLGQKILYFVQSFTKLGFDLGLAKFIPIVRSKDEKNASLLIYYTIRIGVFISIIVGILFFVFSKSISVSIFRKPGLEIVLRVFSVMLPFSTASYLMMAANRGGKHIQHNIQIRQIFYSIGLTCILILALLGKWSFHVFLYALVFLEIVICILFLFSLNRNFQINFISAFIAKKSSTLNGKIKKDLFEFSVPLLFQSMLLYLLGSVDIFMLGYYCPSELIGLYSVALRVALLISFVLSSFNEIFMPEISDKYGKKQFNEIAFLFQTVTKWTFYVSLLIFGIIIMSRREILFIFGPEFLAAEIPLVILCVGHLANSATGGVGIVLEVFGFQKLVLVDSILLLLLNVLLNYYFIFKLELNIIGAAIATSLSLVLVNLIRLAQLWRKQGMQPYNVSYFKVILAFIIACSVTLLVNRMNITSVIDLAANTTIFLIVYISVYYVLGMSEEDRFMMNIIKGILWKKKI